MFHALGSILAVVLLATSAVAGHNHSDVRRSVIKSQLAQAGDNAVVFVGDSITESALLPDQICGHRVVNAGVGGTTAATYLKTILAGIPRFKASTIVVALGTNDARPNFDPGRFDQNYSDLLLVLREYSSRIVLAGIPPIEPGDLSKQYFDQSAGDAVNRHIKQTAKQNGLRFVDLRSSIASEGMTVDGIHLSPAGYRSWLSAIGCP